MEEKEIKTVMNNVVDRMVSSKITSLYGIRHRNEKYLLPITITYIYGGAGLFDIDVSIDSERGHIIVGDGKRTDEIIDLMYQKYPHDNFVKSPIYQNY